MSEGGPCARRAAGGQALGERQIDGLVAIEGTTHLSCQIWTIIQSSWCVARRLRTSSDAQEAVFK